MVEETQGPEVAVVNLELVARATLNFLLVIIGDAKFFPNLRSNNTSPAYTQRREGHISKTVTQLDPSLAPCLFRCIESS